MKDLYKNALAVQNACNLLGISKAFSRDIQLLADELRKEGSFNLSDLRSHPIVMLWIDKLNDLSGYDINNVSEAYSIAYQVSEEVL